MRQVVLALLLWPVLASLAHSDDTAKQADYYPLAVGNKWHYSVELDGEKVTAIISVAKLEKVGDKTLAHLETRLGSEVISEEDISTNAQGAFRQRESGQEVTPPLCLIKYPVKVGDEWETPTKRGKLAVTITGRVDKLEEIEVAGRKYQTVKVILKTKLGAQVVSTTNWFADGVGVVRIRLEQPGNISTFDLEKFEKGAKKTK